MTRRWQCSAWLAALLAALSTGCNEAALKQQPPDSGPPVAGLTPEQAARVVAKVGNKEITLGDFAETLERMDQFDRLRYQTKERRRELLSEIIDAELLAMEAKRRGLDKTPEAEDAVRQILRDAILAQARAVMPAPAEIPASEIRAFYEANSARFSEPERRRVSAIVMDDKKEAEKVLKAAQKIKNASEWGELFYKHSITAPKTRGSNAPLELAGDLGIVGPPDDPKGANVKVPEAVRTAVFQIGNVGSVGGDVVSEGGKHYVIRMNGITAAHHRSLAEADRTIRVALLQEKMQKIERDLETELRKKFQVEIDERSLASVKVPATLDKPDEGTGASAWAPSYAGQAADAGTDAEPSSGNPAQAPNGGP